MDGLFDFMVGLFGTIKKIIEIEFSMSIYLVMFFLISGIVILYIAMKIRRYVKYLESTKIEILKKNIELERANESLSNQNHFLRKRVRKQNNRIAKVEHYAISKIMKTPTK